MFDDGARLCSDDGAGSVEHATGGASVAPCASDARPAPVPTPPAVTPRPQGDSPSGAPPVVSPDIEWRELTPQLERRLGELAWAVWRELIELRDGAGFCRATTSGVARRLARQVRSRQVQKQIDKLRRYGLVGGGGWRYADVPCGQDRQLVEIYEREVIGDRIGSRVALPPDVWARIASGGRGGPRPGAGRRRNQTGSVSADSAGDLDPAAIVTPFDSQENPAQVPSRNHAESVTKESNGVTEVSTKEKDTSMSFVFWLFEPEKKERAERAFSPSGVKCNASGAGAPEAAEAVGAPAPTAAEGGPVDQTQVVVDGSLGDDLPVLRDSEAGVGLAGGGRQRVIRASDWSALPPCPGPAVVAPASIPGPPLIRLETSEDDRVQLCLTAYRLICSRRWPSEWNPYSRGELKPADRKLLVAAAGALCNHQVSPIRWAEFSADQWEHARAAQQAGGKGKKGGRGGNRMPLKMAFSVARIEEHGGWCRHERERRGSRVVWTRSLRTLMAKWQAMRAAVLRGEVTAGDAAGKFFPGDSWERLVFKATADARLEQQRIDTAIAGGEYLW